MSNVDLKNNPVMGDQETCPHTMFDLKMQLVKTLEQQPDGKWKCKFCGAIFDSPDDVKEEGFI